MQLDNAAKLSRSIKPQQSEAAWMLPSIFIIADDEEFLPVLCRLFKLYFSSHRENTADY